MCAFNLNDEQVQELGGRHAVFQRESWSSVQQSHFFLPGSARRAAATARIVSTSGAGLYLSRVSLTEPRLPSHTPTSFFPIKFFIRPVIVRAAEMAVQERKWDHVCKTESWKVRAFCTIGKLQIDQNRFVL
jgi:hypothetical protein